ncbi:MAG: hypothetical protein ACK6AT_11160 [Planctomycetota bacterium]|jgi:ABC-type uncharacterized transport system permease subunit|nr:hypothetical protein [Planctomycetaceae bacterium]MCE2814345.1 hypothetical protein [Planctomycetaceae bacterium]
MLAALLILYALGVSYFCLCTLIDPQERKEIPGFLGWYFAIALPVIAITGGFLHYFEPPVSRWFYYGFLALWLTSILASLDELASLRKVEGGFSLPNILVGLTMLAILFGPGLLLGAIWLKMTPH